MKILIANIGSTSFKYRLLDMTTEATLAKGGFERVTDYGDAIEKALAEMKASGALTRLTLDQKVKQVIGVARIELDRCLLANGQECTECLKCCPFDALTIHSKDGGFSTEPSVDLKKCTGCGACETSCPVRPRRAIRVTRTCM